MGLASGAWQLHWESAAASHSHAKALSSERFSVQPKVTQHVTGNALTHTSDTCFPLKARMSLLGWVLISSP